MTILPTSQQPHDQPRMAPPNRRFAVCLLGASYNTGNRGVSALASGTVNSVLHCHPDATIFLLDYEKHPSTERVRYTYGQTDVELVNIRFSWKIWLPNSIVRLMLAAMILRVLPTCALRQWMLTRHPHLRRIIDADIVMSIGGGDSFADVYGLPRLIYVALPQILVLILKRPLVQLPQTIGPFDGVAARAIARYILRRSSRIYSRDEQSLEVARRFLNTGERLEASFDMAFALEPVEPRTDDLRWFSLPSESPIVGLNLSGLLHVGGYTKDNMFNLKVDYRRLVDQVLLFFIQQMRCRVVLIPHAHKPDDTSESDTIACRAALEQWRDRFANRLHYVGEHHNESETKYLIGRCDFFIGSRMHACVAALSQAVPAVGLAYSDKFIGVWRALGIEDLVLDLRTLDANTILARLQALFDSRLEIRRRLDETMPTVKASVLNLFSRTPLR